MTDDHEDPDSYQPPLFNYRPSGEELRDEGMALVSFNSGEWFLLAMSAIEKLPDDWIGMGEDIREFVSERIGEPHSQNVWGSLVAQARKKNIIESLGEWRKPRDPKSHACQKQVYRKIARYGTTRTG